jgi:4-hydroxy-4-methyl-2-oxoglutarate aldolase
MINISDFPTPLSSDMAEYLGQISPATVGHQHSSGFPMGLTPLVRPARIVGTAVTLSLPTIDSSLMHYAVDNIGPGHVLVVDRQGEQSHACFGGMVGLRLQLSGAAGAVIDGPITDYEDLASYGVPVYHRGVSALTTRIVAPDGALNVPVTIGGCRVEPGDVVIGDSDGLLVIALAKVLEIAEGVIAGQEKELEARVLLHDGMRISDLSGATAKIASALEGN